ncbi:uncharacterized protein LOC126690225 [Quercus robur]|uniref:uncharacterized protein LOC126690225 n=1 Tax=Quercus robur TaxID=38942 RepID=UPI0021628630|nr:uncharacterized protein LOC126690225 [Quercus robur]
MLELLRQKLAAYAVDLHAWGSSKTQPQSEEIKKLQKRIEQLNAMELTEDSKAEFLVASKNLDTLLLKEEIYWAQRSRIPWLKHGDKNTRFFHSKASQRKWRNHIQSIKNAEDVWVEEESDIAGVALEYFETLFKVGTCERLEECLNGSIQRSLQTCSKCYPVCSVQRRSKQCYSKWDQQRRLDLMNALFYQKFWHVVGDMVVNAVLDFLNSGHMVPEINSTYIVLIPKIKSPEKMSDFRPISLSYETLHIMHGRKKGKRGSLVLKLDISKAYDRVEWSFLKGIMIRMGFPEVWVDRVMCCVTTPTYSILINGKTYGNITPSRGLRQEDPLSPYLFLLCTEGFTSLLLKAEMEKRIQGVSICREAPRITNLLFANDSLIFCQTKQCEVQVISKILHVYAKASGQCINLEKSSVFFSSNTPSDQKDWIKESLGVKEVDRFESYLGLPTLEGRAKYHSFAFLKDRVWKKLQGWKGKMLSKVGKEVLIKAVAQYIPMYSMGVFQLPKKLCEELGAMCTKF